MNKNHSTNRMSHVIWKFKIHRPVLSRSLIDFLFESQILNGSTASKMGNNIKLSAEKLIIISNPLFSFIIQSLVSLAHSFQPRSVQSKQDKQQNGKTPKRRTSVAEKRQRDTNYRHNPKYHPNIDSEVKKENTGYAISIHTTKLIALAFGNF